MGLREKILDDMKSAMKSQEADRLSAIRMLQAAVKYREIELRPNTISDQDILGVVKKLTKQRKDSIEEFTKAGRTDLADKEKFELGVLEAYMPAQMSPDAVVQLVNDVIASVGATTMKQMGQVVKEVMAKSGGQADGKQVSDLVKAKLQGT